MQHAVEAMTTAIQVLSDDKAYPPTASSYCLRHRGLCLVRAPESPQTTWSHCWAGVTCLDDSTMGNREGISGEHTRVMLTWLFERVHAQEAIIVSECAKGWGTTTLQNALGQTHDVHCMIICPHDFGWPVTRPRCWTVSVKKSSLAMKMSFQCFCESMGFFKVCMIGGDKLFCEHLDIVKEELARLAVARGEVAQDAVWEDTLTGTQRMRLASMREKKAARSLKREGTPTWIADLDHNLVMDRCSKTDAAIVPCLLRHGTYWKEPSPSSGNEDTGCRPMLKREFLSFQGIHCIPEHHSHDFLPPWWGTLTELTGAQVKQLAGNAMHAQIVYMLLLWLLSCGEEVNTEDVAAAEGQCGEGECDSMASASEQARSGAFAFALRPADDSISVTSSSDLETTGPARKAQRLA